MNINNFIPLNILITEDLYYKGFKSSVIWTCYSNKMFFWNSLPFSMIQGMLATWSLVPLPFLKPAWTSRSSQFMYCRSRLGEFWALLYWRVRWVQLTGSLSILWECFFWGLGWKRTFSSPVATAEFSKFADILSAALSQHHLSGFEIAQLEFHHLH